MSARPARIICCDRRGCEATFIAPGDYGILARSDAALSGWTAKTDYQGRIFDYCPLHKNKA